jgi:predicted RNA-binding protein (virulence factor B family)
MPYRDLLGRYHTLAVRTLGQRGAGLVIDADVPADVPQLLLPAKEVPEGAVVGGPIDVFVYLDSEDRPIATTRDPKLILGEVAFLSCTDKTPFGAFFDWGLPKELLVPNKEQTRDVQVGERHPIALVVDATGRLAGTMRIAEHLEEPGPFTVGEWVEGEAWRNEPEFGLFVIVEASFVGLVPATEPHRLKRGEAARFRVLQVLPDGKIVLSLRAPAHAELESDGAKILALLSRPDPPLVGDHSDPERIRDLFGLSKKAFKRAVGGLLKRGEVAVAPDGNLVVKPT